MQRVRQFAAHLTARVDPAEEADARRLLVGRTWHLFASMPVADRRHALDVATRLRAAGHADPDLLAAALLHDVAKGGRMRLWHRVAGVLVVAVSPWLLERIASPAPRSWRYRFHLYLHHDRLSADQAEAAGASRRTVGFLRRTLTDSGDAQLARALKAADDAS
jgi:hypothetical protein